jgi:ubiquinone/menaquinone biosynthesis C-methylase UbiE
MPEMSRFAQVMCRSAPWRLFAGRVVLPWALQRRELRGDVLEIGCGSGAMAAEILRRFPDVRLIATDYDQSMVDVATRSLAPFGPRAEAQQADATKLPFDDASFDAALSFIMLHHVVDWEQAFAELLRVLRPGGVLVGYDLMGDRGGQLLHGREHDVRLMRRAALERRLDDLPVQQVAIRPSFGGTVARFVAQRTSP